MGPGPAISDDVVDDGRRCRVGSSGVSASAGSGVDGSGVESGFLPSPVGFAVEDEFVGGGLEPVDGGLGEQGVGHQGEPFGWLAVGGRDGGGGAVPFDDELVGVGGVGCVHRLEAEVVEDQQVDVQELADFGVVAVVEPGGFESLEQLIGALEVDAVAAPDGGGRSVPTTWANSSESPASSDQAHYAALDCRAA